MNYEYITTQQRVQELLPVLMAQDSWGTDSESTGLDPHVDKITLLQVGTPKEQYIFDTRKVSVEPLRPFFENDKIRKILHYAKHDYKMMKGDLGIEMEGVRCTYLGERLLNVGRMFRGFGLADVTERRMGIVLDKELQKSFIGHKGEFSKEQLDYSARDVEHLEPILRKQSAELRNSGIDRTFILECDAVSAFGDMEYDGMLIDTDQWRKNMEENKVSAQASRGEMDTVSRQYWPENLFGEVDINYDSPKQLLTLLKMMKIRVKSRDAEGNEIMIPIQDTSKATQKQLRDIPFIQMLGKYRKYQKLIGTYGETYINAIHPKTGRIHPDLDQIGAESGRPTAGESEVNPLNIPRENRYRHAFIAGIDHLIETDDYNGCELRILAEASGDERLLDAFKRGEDVHCYVASLLYGVSVTKDKNNPYKKLRYPAKSLNFGIAYGMGPYKLYMDLNGDGFPITLEEATKLYRKYVDLFSTAVNWLRRHGRIASEEGYLVNMNGRKRYWILPNQNDKERFPKGRYDEDYKKAIGAIQREGGNFMIQSVNADMTKYAMTLVRRYRKQHNIRTSFINAIYDELVTRTHKDDSPTFAPAKRKLMVEAGERWIKSIPVVVDGESLPYWNKD